MSFSPNLTAKFLAGAAMAAVLLASPTYASALLQDGKAPPAKAKAQDEDAKTDKSETDNGDAKNGDAKNAEKKAKTIEDKVKDMTMSAGLFDTYRDPKTGTLYMEISADQLDKEFLYASHLEDGVVWAGHFRGQYRQAKVIKLRKHFDKIELVEINPNFYFQPDSPLAGAADANISSSVIAVEKIAATTEAKESDGEESDAAPERYLIKADALFLSEAFDQIKPSNRPGTKPGTVFTLGKLSRSKTKISKVANYPANTAVQVDYVYFNPAPLNGGGPEVTDPRNVTVKVQHTLIEMPENDYKPRFDDARVGYFLEYVTDLTSVEAAPYRDLINRWHLVKKDPEAELSEPVEPIVWWIENTTPHELRDTIRDATLEWNKAFETAGFKNAIQVKVQPDDAEWDAGDIRYNVLRWTSSPNPPFGGYGPSFANPRTGQILGADVMLEFVFLKNRLNTGKIFEKAALNHSNPALELVAEQLGDHMHNCNMAGYMQMNNMLGTTLASTIDDYNGDHKRLLKESLYYLILHEVGHTLGLNHNMKATQTRSYETVHDISAQSDGLAGSVMDYPALNFAKKGAEQAHYYSVTPGSYDHWAIQFGYDPDLDDPAKRAAHLARSSEPGHQFGNDADDMRSPGKGIDPRVNINDFTDDAVAYARDRLELEKDAMRTLLDRLSAEGESYQAVRNAFLVVTADMGRQGDIASRYIGGVMVDRSTAGQNGASDPYVPVSADKQREAMGLLRDYIFAPDAFAVDEKLLRHIAMQRRGFAHFTTTEDPKMHGRVLNIQAGILAHLLHPVTLARITDSGLYGNTYSVAEMMEDLTSSIFDADSRTSVNSYRQGLQVHYTKQLIDILGANFDYVAQSSALASLRKIKRNMARWRGDAATRAHRDHVSFLIDKALETHGAS